MESDTLPGSGVDPATATMVGDGRSHALRTAWPLQALHTLSQLLTQTSDFETIFTIVHQVLAKGFQCDIAQIGLLIALYDPGKKQISIPYISLGDAQEAVEPYTLREDVLSEMIYGRQSVVWDDPAEARETGIPALSGKTVRSLAGIPLLAGGDAIGGIVLLDIQRSQVYAREDLLWLEPLASQLASSLQSGLIVESSKQQFVLDRRLFEVANNIRNSPDMRSILAATAIELGKVLQAQKVHIVIAPEFLTQTDIPASGVEAAPGDSTPGAEAAPGLEAPNG